MPGVLVWVVGRLEVGQSALIQQITLETIQILHYQGVCLRIHYILSFLLLFVSAGALQAL